MKELFREIAVFNTYLFRCMLFCNIKIGLNDDTHDVGTGSGKDIWYWYCFGTRVILLQCVLHQ